MDKKSNILIILLLVSTALSHAQDKYYSLQVLSVTNGELQQGVKLSNTLIKEGYLSYIYRHKIDGYGQSNTVYRVMMGCYSTAQQALEDSLEVKKLGLSFFVDNAPIRVSQYKDSLEIVTTPQAIWMRQRNINKILYPLREVDYRGKVGNEVNRESIIDEIQPDISHDGKNIVFMFNYNIIRVVIETGDTTILIKGYNFVQDGLSYSEPQWSPDDKYIAFMDCRGFEELTSLWIMDADGDHCKRLVDTRKTDNAIKYFRWHPTEDIVYFVKGYAWGTVSRGGALYKSDLSGHVKKVKSPPGLEWEIADFSISEDTIHYELLHFTDNAMVVKKYRKAIALNENTGH